MSSRFAHVCTCGYICEQSVQGQSQCHTAPWGLVWTAEHASGFNLIVLDTLCTQCQKLLLHLLVPCNVFPVVAILQDLELGCSDLVREAYDAANFVPQNRASTKHRPLRLSPPPLLGVRGAKPPSSPITGLGAPSRMASIGGGRADSNSSSSPIFLTGPHQLPGQQQATTGQAATAQMLQQSQQQQLQMQQSQQQLPLVRLPMQQSQQQQQGASVEPAVQLLQQQQQQQGASVEPAAQQLQSQQQQHGDTEGVASLSSSGSEGGADQASSPVGQAGGNGVGSQRWRDGKNVSGNDSSGYGDRVGHSWDGSSSHGCGNSSRSSRDGSNRGRGNLNS